MNLKVRKANAKQSCACYVLITCTEPDESGKMQVALDYEGDETLAAYLVENAAQVFDNERSGMRKFE